MEKLNRQWICEYIQLESKGKEADMMEIRRDTDLFEYDGTETPPLAPKL